MLTILDGELNVALTTAFTVALKMKGETEEELTGFACAMRERVTPVDVDHASGPLLDTCGTGGEGPRTFNISTIAALVAAGAGVRVAKHGNRSLSSLCGSADLIEALGVRISTDPAEMSRSIRQTGIGFLFAPALHPAMRHVQPIRRELKTRTVFNLLGPLTNPAGARRQLIGAPSEQTARLMAHALSALGAEFAYVVHGSDGIDEITTTGSTAVFEVTPGRVAEHVWFPSDFGVPRASLEDIAGAHPEHNRAIAEAVLSGAKGPARDIVLVNAAAALIAAGLAQTPAQAMRLAAESIDSGAARNKLEQLRGLQPAE
jgi:anthranilate phosphoribosyltransferase